MSGARGSSLAQDFPAAKDPVASPAPVVTVLRGHFAAHWAALDATAKSNLLGIPGGLPLVGPSPDGNPVKRAVTFLHRSPEATAVVLSANALVNHRNVGASEFEKVDASGLWALTLLMPADWECGYRITTHQGAGTAPWQASTDRRTIRMAADAGAPDPLNPLLGAGMNGGALSVLRLPGAPAAPWLAPAVTNRSAGSPAMGGSQRADAAGTRSSAGLEGLTLRDSLSGRLRTVWVYSPPVGTRDGDTPLLLLHDGQVWAKYLNLKDTLDAAIRSSIVPALHVAMIDSLDSETRSDELSGPTGTVDFVANDLLPVLRERLPVRGDAAGTIVSGASYGGLASLWQVARYPQLVGVALAQSPSLWRYDLSQPLEKVLDRVVLRLQAGIYESDIHQTSQELFNQLAPLGADISLSAVTGGHDWTWWNPWLIHGLRELLQS
ncbi:enterochelin esterase domain-containing protein [Arthrobacter glacialis]|uniref:enterochelin esterase domain-containing protein n=1 Tax=Arthrobacter glacialis TaxID=1664 RepID=UPI000CD3F588|nr:alpha/beta hydrolase-fold protein [Arthrobacter glacialis]POH57668.1 esterase family protein [Arthrobacter glacialis]